MENKLQIVFSMLTGETYEIEEDEIKNLDRYQILLKKRPSTSCNKCYGRMYEGFSTTMKLYIPCSKCVNRCVDFTKQKEDVDIDITRKA